MWKHHSLRKDLRWLKSQWAILFQVVWKWKTSHKNISVIKDKCKIVTMLQIYYTCAPSLHYKLRKFYSDPSVTSRMSSLEYIGKPMVLYTIFEYMLSEKWSFFVFDGSWITLLISDHFNDYCLCTLPWLFKLLFHVLVCMCFLYKCLLCICTKSFWGYWLLTKIWYMPCDWFWYACCAAYVRLRLSLQASNNFKLRV